MGFMRFSIVTVCWNSEATVTDTVRSVAAQDFTDYEHLIIDGGSTDGTLEAVRSVGNPRVRVISEPDDGIYDAMNKGLRASRGDYVLFLNSDDLLARADALSLVAAAADGNVDCVFASTRMVAADGRTPAGRIYHATRFRRWWMNIAVMPPHPSAFIRRSTLLGAGGFDTSFRISADFDLLAKVVLRDRATWVALPEITTNFRVGGLSTNGFRTNIKIGHDIRRSLRSLNHPFPALASHARYLWKAAQYFSRG